MKDAQEDVVREMRQAMSEGLDDNEMSKRITHLFASQDMRAHRVENEARVYSECEDMNEMKAKYLKTSEYHTDHSLYDDESSVDEASTMTYDLSTGGKVSVEQAKRIVQKMKLHL